MITKCTSENCVRLTFLVLAGFGLINLAAKIISDNVASQKPLPTWEETHRPAPVAIHAPAPLK